MSCYGEKEKFPVSGLTSGLTTINRKKMTLPTQGRTLWAAKIVLPLEVAEKRGEYTEKSSIDIKKPHIEDEKQPIEVEKQPIEEVLLGLQLTHPTYANMMKLYNEFRSGERDRPHQRTE